MALAQRRITCRPPLTRRHRTGSTRRACLPPAQERRTESHGEQRFPQPNHPRNVYVPATESRPEAGTDDELRAFVHPAPFRRCPELRRKPLLYQRRQPDYDDSCRRTPPQRQLGRNRELGSGREHCLPHQPPMERKRQLQLGAHGTSGHLGSGAQAVCRRRLPARKLGRVDRHPVHQRAIYLRQPCQYRGLRALELACQLPPVPVCLALCARREPLGTTLRNHGWLSHAESHILGRNPYPFLIPYKCPDYARYITFQTNIYFESSFSIYETAFEDNCIGKGSIYSFSNTITWVNYKHYITKEFYLP